MAHGAGGATIAQLAGKAAARSTYKPPAVPQTDNPGLDRQNLARVGFLNAERLRQMRLANDAVQAGRLNSQLPQAEPMHESNTPKAALGRLLKAAPSLGMNPQKIALQGLTGYQSSGGVGGGGLAKLTGTQTPYRITDPLSHYTNNPRESVGPLAQADPFYTPLTFQAAGYYGLAKHPGDVVQLGKNVIRSFEPGHIGASTALNAIALASLLRGGGARLGAARAAIKDESFGPGAYRPSYMPGKTGAVLHALGTRPVGGMRTLNYGGQQTLALNSESPLVRDITKLHDKALGLDSGAKRPAVLSRIAKAKFNIEEAQNQRSREAISAAGQPQEITKRGTTEGPFLRGLDTVNRASRAAILYGRPGYLPPNIAGQEWLSLTHQGAYAARNRLAASQLGGKLGALTGKRLDPTTVARLRAASGEGIMQSLEPGTGVGSRIEAGVRNVDQALGSAFGSVLDTPYRTAAVLHELRRQGIKNPEEIRSALGNYAASVRRPGGALEGGTDRKVLEASRRSTRAMIDYGRLGPITRGARHAVFFTPWLKGSSLYAGHYALNHPAQLAAAFATGQYGAKHTGLAPTPGFMQGDFKVGTNKKGQPMVVNPTSAGIIQQPLQLADMVAGIIGAEPIGTGNDPNSVLTPGLSALEVALTHQDPFSHHTLPSWYSPLKILKDQLVGQIPAVSLLRRERNPPENNPKALFPYSRRDALMANLLGGFGPRPVNPQIQQSRYRADVVSSAGSPQDVAKIKSGFVAQDITSALKQHGVPVRPPLLKALSVQQNFNIAQATWHKQLGGGIDSGVKILALVQASGKPVSPALVKRIQALRQTPAGLAQLKKSESNLRKWSSVGQTLSEITHVKNQLGVKSSG